MEEMVTGLKPIWLRGIPIKLIYLRIVLISLESSCTQRPAFISGIIGSTQMGIMIKVCFLS